MRQQHQPPISEKLQGSSEQTALTRDAAIGDKIGSLIFNIQLSKATELARAGCYGEAETLLADMTPHNEEPALLDLRARICVQQGQLNKAEGYWRRAMEKHPDHLDYAKGLVRIAALQRKPVAFLFIWPVFLILSVTILLIVLPGFFSSKTKAIPEANTEMLNHIETQQNELSKQIQALEKNLNTLSQPLQQLQSDIAAITQQKRTETASEDPVLPTIKLDIPGVLIRQKKEGPEIIFETGLFENGSVLTPAGRTRLSAIGKALETHATEINLRIVGHTDDRAMSPGATYKDNVHLGLDRAAAVVLFMRNHSRLPFQIYTLKSVGEFNPPFANDNPENQQRNRTVTIQLLPHRS